MGFQLHFIIAVAQRVFNSYFFDVMDERSVFLVLRQVLHILQILHGFYINMSLILHRYGKMKIMEH